MSLIKPKDKAAPFFFTLNLVGPGLDDNSGSPDRKGKSQDLEITRKKSEGASPRKDKKLADPISKSIQERKDYGSYLSVIKNKDKAEEQ